MKWIKSFNENWYGLEKDYTINVDYSKFLNDLDYTYSIIKELNPELRTQWQDWFDAYSAWKKDGFPDKSDEELQMEYGENPKSYELHIRENIKFYSELYNKVKREGSLKVFRALSINDINDVNYNNLGVYWSFIENPDQSFEHSTFKIYIKIYGEVNFNNIDWLNSLDNFVFYGHDESEIKLKRNVDVFVEKIKIIEKTLSNNIKRYDLEGNLIETDYYDFKNSKDKTIILNKNFKT